MPLISPVLYTLVGVRASDRAYSTLREEILEGAMAPGTVLGEVEQSARLGLSRTPLREALSRLVADGLAEPSPGRGVVVTAVSLAEAPQLYDLRTALETLAVRRAAERSAVSEDADAPAPRFARLADRFEQATADLAAGTDPSPYYALTRELDAAVDAACGNAYLADALRGLRLHLGRLRRLARHSPTRLAASAHEHAAIARAVADGDPELASAATTVHLRRALAHLRASETAVAGETAETTTTGPTATAPTSTASTSTAPSSTASTAASKENPA